MKTLFILVAAMFFGSQTFASEMITQVMNGTEILKVSCVQGDADRKVWTYDRSDFAKHRYKIQYKLDSKKQLMFKNDRLILTCDHIMVKYTD